MRISFKGQIHNFPDHFTDEQIAKALGGGKAPEQRNYAERVAFEAVPAVANIAGDVVRSIPAGLYGAGQAIYHGSMEKGFEGYQEGMKALQDNTPRFRGPRIEAMEETAMEGMDKIREFGGEVAHRTTEAVAGREAAYGLEPFTRTMGEVAVDLAPIPGVEMVSRIPRVGSRWKAERAAKQKLDDALAEAERIEPN